MSYTDERIPPAEFLRAKSDRSHFTAKTGEAMDAGRIICHICEKNYKNKKQLQKHIVNIHGIKKKGTIPCVVDNCLAVFLSLDEYRSHLVKNHGLKIDSKEILNFSNREEFEKWLHEEEQSTNTHFVKPRGERRYNSHSVIVYVCNRSGTFKSDGQGKRQLKAQGTSKIGYHCPASINVKIFKSHLEVTYYKDHYKHDNSFCHLPLPKQEKEVIAGKLLQGVSEKRILQDVRLSLTDTPQRKHLITRKDIFNVKQSFGMQLASKGSVIKTDEESVDAWVQEMSEKDFNPVLIYKKQGQEFPELNKQDFFLVLMTTFQRKILQNLGCDRLCVDSTHGISGYGFELVTLIAIDEYEEGIPVAFCISSSVSTQTLCTFFQCIKNVVPSIKPNIFMSDDAPMFYNAWEKIFGMCKHRLLCSWHVDRAWRGHLNCIKNKEKKEVVYKTLKTLLYELDENSFYFLLEKFMEQLEEDFETKEFYNYFLSYYHKRIKMWAYCFRKNAKLNTNMHVESFHRTLKHIYLDGKKVKRLDKCILELINLVNDKQFDKFIKEQKGKITKKCTINFNRHKNAKSLINYCKKLANNNWEIVSESNIYNIHKNHTCNDKCIIACRICYCCFSAYTCTCFDNTISNNMCKHIHAVVISEKQQCNYTGPLNKIKNTFNTSTTSISLEVSKNNSASLDKVINKYNSLYTKLNSAQHINSITAQKMMEHLNAIEHLLHIDQLPNTHDESSTTNSEPVNKLLTKQKRFFSAKKQNRTKRMKISNPTNTESRYLKKTLMGQPLVITDPSNDHLYFKRGSTN